MRRQSDHAFHRRKERGRCERLGKTHGTRELFLVAISETGDEHDVKLRPQSVRISGELQPVHNGHDDIGQQKSGLCLLQNLQSFHAAGGFSYTITSAFEHVMYEMADGVIVLHNQHHGYPVYPPAFARAVISRTLPKLFSPRGPLL